MSTSEMTNRIAETSSRPLRLWPGMICIVLLLLFRFALKAVIPGFEGFMWAIQGSLGCAVAILPWWLVFSRAPWPSRRIVRCFGNTEKHAPVTLWGW